MRRHAIALKLSESTPTLSHLRRTLTNFNPQDSDIT